jgi:outer membrane protein assembly factor BamB
MRWMHTIILAASLLLTVGIPPALAADGPYLLQVTVVGDGHVNTTNEWVEPGLTHTLIATPSFGGCFLRWVGDIPEHLATSATATLTMNQPRALRALFLSPHQTTELLVGDWPTFGNGPSHSGYLPGILAPGSMTQRWTRAFDTPIHQVAIGDGQIYITPDQYFGDAFLQAIDEKTGADQWRHTFPECYSLTPPSYANGAVYLQRVNNHEDTHLWRFDATTGTVAWNAPHASQWGQYMAPTVADGSIWINGGAYGGLYGFDEADGRERFFSSALEQYDSWTPTYHNHELYSWVAGHFRAHNPDTGELEWELDLGGEWPERHMNRTIAADGQWAFVTSADGGLHAIDLIARRVAWSITGEFTGTPAVANSTVYAITGSHIASYATRDGTPQTTYAASEPLAANLIVCDNALFATSGERTFVFDVGEATPRQVLPAAGPLSLAHDTLYIAGPSTLHAYQMDPFPVTHTLHVSGEPQQLATATPTYGAYTLLPDAPIPLEINTNTITTSHARYLFAGWEGTGDAAGSGPDHALSFGATTNSTLTWLWHTEHPLTIIASNGWVTGATTGWKPAGFIYDLYPTNTIGHAFDHWRVNGTPAGRTIPLTVTIDAPYHVEAVFVPIFIDVTPHTQSHIAEWKLDRQTGTYLATLELHNPSDASKILAAPFWYVHQPTDNIRLMHPDGIETNSGLPYLDITAATHAALPHVGNGDTKLDPGETVRISGIELFSRDRRPPTGILYAIWADPPVTSDSHIITDTDADGLPNIWEREFLGALSEHDPANAQDDSDGDGASNLHEYHADTNPADPKDQLRLERITPDGPHWLLDWHGGAAVTQYVDWSPDLTTWSCIYTNTPPTPRGEQRRLRRDLPHTGYFRLRVPAR